MQVEAYANANRLRNLQKLSEWRSEHSADALWQGEVDVLGMRSADMTKGVKRYSAHTLEGV
jgi:hypothetical protein